MVDSRKIGTGPRGSVGAGKIGAPVPVGIPPILRRFWDFTKKTAHEFARQLKDPEDKEAGLIKEVTKRF